MFEAQLLVSKGSGDPYAVFSPWFPRGGESVRATLEVVAKQGSPTLTVRVFTKNSEDSGDGTDSQSSTTIAGTAVGRTTQEWDSNATTNTATIEELVRYRFEIESETAGDWLLFRMLSPVWFDAVKA